VLQGDRFGVQPTAAGESISAAPEMKSETTASMGTPSPAIMMPVFPASVAASLRPAA
jgi:hypothetical protein